MRWGDEWLSDGAAPTVLVHETCGHPLDQQFVCWECDETFSLTTSRADPARAPIDPPPPAAEPTETRMTDQTPHPLLHESLSDLMALASARRDDTFGTRVTYSPKVFIPLTFLCNDSCGYCTFAQPPAHVDKLFLDPDDVLKIARQGARRGCHEALFTLGERPEDRYEVARDWLTTRGYDSTVHYVAEMAELVLRETGLLPHANAGALSADELAAHPARSARARG